MCSSLCVAQSILSTGHHHLRFLVTTNLTRERHRQQKSITFSWGKASYYTKKGFFDKTEIEYLDVLFGITFKSGIPIDFWAL